MTKEKSKSTVSGNRRQVILSEEYCKKADEIGTKVTETGEVKVNRSEGIRLALDAYEKKGV